MTTFTSRDDVLTLLIHLSYTIGLALYAAKDYYTIVRELPGGKGFADIAFIPKPNHSDKPALIVELKWDKSTIGAIEQIKNNSYASTLDAYKNNMLLISINYDKKTKKHTCAIEKYDF